MGKSTISMAIFNSYVCLPECKGREEIWDDLAETGGIFQMFFSKVEEQELSGMSLLKMIKLQ